MGTSVSEDPRNFSGNSLPTFDLHLIELYILKTYSGTPQGYESTQNGGLRGGPRVPLFRIHVVPLVNLCKGLLRQEELFSNKNFL